MSKNWVVLSGRLFHGQLADLVGRVEKIVEESPDNHETHPDFKLLKSLRREIDNIARSPFHKDYAIGKTLYNASLKTAPRLCFDLSHWRRAKKRLPARRRLFFWPKSSSREVVLVWLNPESCLRKEGSKTDVYRVFCGLLRRGEIPNSWDDLISSCPP